jgi:hypothetical protein
MPHHHDAYIAFAKDGNAKRLCLPTELKRLDAMLPKFLYTLLDFRLGGSRIADYSSVGCFLKLADGDGCGFFGHVRRRDIALWEKSFFD